MAERNAWTHVEEAIHRLGGWYADQRVVDELRPVIDRYAATLGYSPAGPADYSPSQPMTVDKVPEEVREQITLDVQARLTDEITLLKKQLGWAGQARDNFQEESAAKDRHVQELEAARDIWQFQAQELETERDKLIGWHEEDLKTLEELRAAYKESRDEVWRLRNERENDMKIPTWDGTPPSIDPGAILDQACAAAERAEKAADGAAEAVLKVLTRLYPGSFQVGSDGRVWTLVGTLDADDAALRDRLVKGLGQAERGETHDLGDFTQYAGLDDDTDLTETDTDHMITEAEPVVLPSGQQTTGGLRGLMEHVGIDTTGRDISVAGKIVDAHSERIRMAAKESAAPLMPAGPPPGMKRCSSCATVKPLEKFRKDSSKVSGYRSQCKECQSGIPGTFQQAAVSRVRGKLLGAPPLIRTVSSGTLSVPEKTCNECAQTKPVEAFSKDAKALGGVKAKCKVCCAKRDAENGRRRRAEQKR